MRNFAHAGDLARTALARWGVTEERYAIFQLWEHEAGEFVPFAEVVGFDRGILRVRVTNSSCYQELALRKRSIIARLNAHYQRVPPVVKDIHITV